MGRPQIATNKHRYKAHIQYHKKPKKHKCPIDGCDHTTKTKQQLEDHISSHSDERPYQCDDCDSSFKKETHLKEHIKLKHNDIRDFHCDECDYSAKTQSMFRTHKKKVHGNDEIQCKYEGCDYIARHHSYMKKHIETIHGDPIYICEDCGKALTTDKAIKEHMIYHEDKQFQCTFTDCDAMFYTSGDQRRHEILHGEKQFKCKDENCSYEAHYQFVIDRHYEKIHSEEGMLRQKRQEEKIARLLTKHGIPFAREHSISFSCISDANKYARIDFVIEMNGGIIFLEVDEHQHRFGYDSVNCDLKRMSYVMESLVYSGNTLPILWLRYNPNVYRENGIKQLIRQYEREEVLVDFMRNWTPGSDMEIKYFYYNLVDGELEIHRNEEYDDYFKSLCI